MPVPRKAYTSTSTGTPHHSPVKDIHGLGAQYFGTFPKSHRGFTKWQEATTVIKANKNSVLKFIKDMVARFGAPNRIITDNGT